MNLFEKDIFLGQDFFNFFCGELIGDGRDRKVYVFNFDPTKVIKIDVGGNFANVTEWEMWQNVSKQRKEIEKFFAPCYKISSCGRVLLQARTEPLKEDIEIEIPKFMWDLRKCNWGYFQDRLVSHDYANHTLYKEVNNDLIPVKIH